MYSNKKLARQQP